MKKVAPRTNRKPGNAKRSISNARPDRDLAQNKDESQARTPIDRAELKSFLALKHGNPHSILGPHQIDGGVVVRAFRPDAEAIEILVGARKPRRLERIHDAGVFEIFIPDLPAIPSYRLKVYYPNDNVFIQRDAYAFAPTLGDLDLHLFGEGKHVRIYEKLGAHLSKAGRIQGVAFAVWAPGAAGVSVVGDFNGWDGRLHQMRRLGSSGVWELFIPELAAGSLYKYEIRGRRGLPFLKADPYANYTEVPPDTSSIVYQPAYKFHDAQWRRERQPGTLSPAVVDLRSSFRIVAAYC
jgi:1,4-alpha-glucan branching enzyme